MAAKTKREGKTELSEIVRFTPATNATKRNLLQVARCGSKAQVRTWRNLLAAFQKAQADYYQFVCAMSPLAKIVLCLKPFECGEAAANLKAAATARNEFVDAFIATLRISVVMGTGEVFQNIPVSRKAGESS